MLTDSVLNRLTIMDLVELIEKHTKDKLTDIPDLDFYYRLWMTGLYDNRRTKHLFLKYYKSLFAPKIDSEMRAFEKLITDKRG